jgi:hypothetical protein
MARHVRCASGAAVALLLAAAGPALAGQDAIYHYRPAQELPVLRSYHQQPYWRALAECSGIHGVLMDRLQAGGRTEAANVSRQRAVAMLQRANARLVIDRGVSEAEALTLTTPMVTAGRGSGETLLGMRQSGRTHSPEQLAVSACAQLADRDAEASRRGR